MKESKYYVANEDLINPVIVRTFPLDKLEREGYKKLTIFIWELTFLKIKYSVSLDERAFYFRVSKKNKRKVK